MALIPPSFCPSCKHDSFHPLPHAGGEAFVRISILREDQALRGDLVMGGDNGFIARVFFCKDCGFTGLYRTADAPAGSGGASIHLGGGSRIESR